MYYVYGYCISVSYLCVAYFFFFKQKTSYDLRISDWSSDVCSSDLKEGGRNEAQAFRKLRIQNQGNWHQQKAGKGAPVAKLGLYAKPGRPAWSAKIAPCKQHGANDQTGNDKCGKHARSDVLAGHERQGWQIGRASCRARVCQYG